MPSTTRRAPGQPQGGQRGVFLALDHALAAERLSDDGQPGQAGQHGQHPPPDGLGVDRRRHGRVDAVLVLLKSRRAGH